MPHIGLPELVALAIIAMLVIGPERLPEVTRFIARMIRRARTMIDDIRDELETDPDLHEVRRVGRELKGELHGLQNDLGSAARNISDPARMVRDELRGPARRDDSEPPPDDDEDEIMRHARGASAEEPAHTARGASAEEPAHTARGAAVPGTEPLAPSAPAEGPVAPMNGPVAPMDGPLSTTMERAHRPPPPPGGPENGEPEP